MSDVKSAWPTLIWRIENFWEIIYESTVYLGGNYSYFLSLQPRLGRCFNEDKFVLTIESIAFLNEGTFENVYLTCCIRDKNGKEWFPSDTLIEYFTIGTNPVVWTVNRKELLEKYDLLEETNAGVHNLTLICMWRPQVESEINIQIESGTEGCTEVQQATDGKDSESANNVYDYLRFFHQSILPDIQIKCDGTLYPVHSTVLSSFSEKLLTDLLNVTADDSNEVGIKSMTPVDLEQFLFYLYTGTVTSMDCNTAYELYVIGHDYGVKDLLKRSSNVLMEMISDVNAVDYLSWAEKYKDQVFKNDVINFIVKNGRILKSSRWLDLSRDNPKLACEVYESFVKKHDSVLFI